MSLTNSKLQTWLWPLAVLITAATGCTPTDNVLPPSTSTLGLSKVHVDEERAAKATISAADGGTITATDANGAVYTLTLAEGALDDDVEIAMYPVSAIDTLPFAAGVLAGVHITPEGLNLRIPATLTIDLPSPPDPIELVGVASKRDGEELQLYPTILEGQKVTFDIFHFSGYDVGNAQENELVNMPPGTTTGAIAQGNLVSAFKLAQRNNQDPGAAFTRILHDWYVASVKPLLQVSAAATSTPSSFLEAELEYGAWRSAVKFAILESGIFPSSPDIAEGEVLAVAMCRKGYALYNEQARANAGNDPNVSDLLINPLFFASLALSSQSSAHEWGIDTVANQLDLATALNNLAVQVVIESATLPSGFRDGQSANLRLQAGVTIAGGPVRHDVPLKIKVNQNGATNTVIPAQGTTDAGGVFTTAVGWPTGLAELKINILARIANPLGSRIRRFEVVTRSSSGSGTPAVRLLSGDQTRAICEDSGLTALVSGLANKSVTWTASAGVTITSTGGPDDEGSSFAGFRTGHTAGTFTVTVRSVQDPAQSAVATIIVDDFAGDWRTSTTVSQPVQVLRVSPPIDGLYPVHIKEGSPVNTITSGGFSITRNGGNYTGPGTAIGFPNLVITGTISSTKVTGELFSNGASLGTFTLDKHDCPNP